MNRPAREHAFSLMVAVVAIALIGVSLTTMIAMGPVGLRADAIAQTDAQLDTIASAIENWTLDSGNAPTSLAQLTTHEHLGPYLYDPIQGTSVLADAFHSTIQHQNVDADTVRLRSYGPDRIANTEDDLVRDIDIGGIRSQITRDRLTLVNAAIAAYYQRNGRTEWVPGLAAIYYDNQNWTGTTAATIDSQINRTFTSPYPVGNNSTLSAEWLGTITPPYSQTYTFYLTIQDSGQLWIDERLVVDAPTAGTYSGSLLLTGGQPLPIYVKYANTGTGGNIKLEWNSTGLGSRQVISSSYLSTEIDNLLPSVTTAKDALYDDHLLPKDGQFWTDAWGSNLVADPAYPDYVERLVSSHLSLLSATATTTLTGIVYNESGNTLSGAAIKLKTGVNDAMLNTTSGANGTFSFSNVTISRTGASVEGNLGTRFGQIRGFCPVDGGVTDIRFYLSLATNVALGRPVTVEGPLAYDSYWFPNTNPVVVTDGYMQDTSLGLYNPTNVWWNTVDFVRINVDLQQTRLVTGVIVMVHSNDEYILEYRDPLTEEWNLLWDISIVAPAPNPGWLWPVRPNHYDWSETHTVGPLYADKVRIYARSDNTTWCGVNEIQIYGF